MCSAVFSIAVWLEWLEIVKKAFWLICSQPNVTCEDLLKGFIALLVSIRSFSSTLQLSLNLETSCKTDFPPSLPNSIVSITVDFGEVKK